jgi:hypothetical protein
MCLGDITRRTDHFILTLKQSKADPFRKGVDIKLFCTNSALCPKCQLARYLKRRQYLFQGSASTDSCFINDNGAPLTRADFLRYLNITLTAAGFDNKLYTGHSFRIGAATSAASVRIEDHLIKTMGRWSSDSYCRYIQTPASALHSAQVSLASP